MKTFPILGNRPFMFHKIICGDFLRLAARRAKGLGATLIQRVPQPIRCTR